MRKLPSSFAPLGRLYDPLLGLAARIHRVLGARCKTIVTDRQGNVFVDHILSPGSMSPRSIVGTYDAHTALFVIEDDLRFALRERASQWITDWTSQESSAPRREHRRMSSLPAQGRRIRARAPIAGAPVQPSVMFENSQSLA
ncbi:MAG TPA: hypothetical protein VK753_08995 [Xanthomonadaceae bacterium]|nr:hypothetical protein [Xanthomonadaceae bacterium]